MASKNVFGASDTNAFPYNSPCIYISTIAKQYLTLKLEGEVVTAPMLGNHNKKAILLFASAPSYKERAFASKVIQATAFPYSFSATPLQLRFSANVTEQMVKDIIATGEATLSINDKNCALKFNDK